MSFFCCSSNILKYVVDISNIDISTNNISNAHIDLSLNAMFDILNVHIDLSMNDMSNNIFDNNIFDNNIFDNDIFNLDITSEKDALLDISKTVNNTIIDISNNSHHILNVKQQFLSIDNEVVSDKLLDLSL